MAARKKAKKKVAKKKVAKKKYKKKSKKNAKKKVASKTSNLTHSAHYDYVPIIDREPYKLPNGARVAVMPYINIEHFPADIPGTAASVSTETAA